MADKSDSILVVMGGGEQSPLAKKVLSALNCAKAQAVFASGVKNLRGEFALYKVVITYYGLSAFEAVAAGCAVILVSPTRLHKKLALRAGFTQTSISSLKKASVLKALIQKATLESSVLKSKMEKDGTPSLESLINTLATCAKNNLPLKQTAGAKVILRTPTRTFCQDERTGVIYLSLTSEKVSTYGEDYFSNEYKAQYGVTYLEDFDKIKAQGLRRLATIEKILAHSGSKLAGKKLLDAGCAYGAFMAAASEKGVLASGLDVCGEATEYVKNSLHLSATKCSFMDADESEKFDILSMWFVIEHLADLDGVLLKANKMVRRGGVFALSTPNSRGITARRDLKKFLLESPVDHLAIFSPKSAKKLLSRYGFKVVKVLSTTVHSERFPPLLKRFPSLCAKLSRLFVLSDTFELYAVKV